MQWQLKHLTKERYVASIIWNGDQAKPRWTSKLDEAQLFTKEQLTQLKTFIKHFCKPIKFCK